MAEKKKRKKIIEKFLLVSKSDSHHYYITSSNPKNQESGNMKSFSRRKYNPHTRQHETFVYKKLPPHSK